MAPSVPAPEITPASDQARYISRRFMICSFMILGIACLGIGTVIWQQQSAERWYQLGLEAIPRGDVVVLVRSLRHLSGNSSRAQLLQGALDLLHKRPENALKHLEVAVQDPQTALWAQFLAGEALCRLEQYEACIRTLRGALEQDPGNVDGHRWLAIAAFDIGASAEAVQQLREVIRLDSGDPRAYRMLGLIYMEAEEFPQAIEAYRASLDRSRDQPDIEQILIELAAAEIKVNRYEDVLATLQGAPPSLELDSLRAEALYALGQSAEAKQIVKQVLKSGKTLRVLILEGLIFLDEGRAADAVSPLQKAVAMEPENFETRAKLTQAYAQAGNVEAAKRELLEFERIKKIRQEIHELSLAAANQPNAADVRYELGLRYRKLDLIPTARKWIRAALALNPVHAAAQKALAELSMSTSTSHQHF
jgi:tetratricopeptide (TPR) repeat protein